MIVYYYDGQLEKDDNKEYYLFKRVSTQGTLFLYYKSKEKTKDEIEKEELNNEINSLKEMATKINSLEEKLRVAQEAIDFLIQIGGEV